MNPLFRSRTIAGLAFTVALTALLPMCRAQRMQAQNTDAQNTQMDRHTLDKHARKVEKTLSKYEAGAYVHLEMRDGTDLFGTLGALEDTSFRFVDTDNNATDTIAYDSVERVRHDAQKVDEREYPHHHRHLLPVLLIGAAAGAGAAVYFTYVH
ncbi:MAG TPA: hypothetical protein VFU55_09375 [Terracidiphilus sp.]|nr:hypothetical protein [Terracidiphilus sp.]